MYLSRFVNLHQKPSFVKRSHWLNAQYMPIGPSSVMLDIIFEIHGLMKIACTGCMIIV